MTEPIHRYRRFKGWDYAKGASLFITIGIEPRRHLFGEIIDGEVRLSWLGEKALGALEVMPKLNPGIMIFGRVVMPDHIHFNCALKPGLSEPLMVLGRAIRRFKNYITAEAKRSLVVNDRRSDVDGGTWVEDGAKHSHDGETVFRPIWQQGYHDYLLVSREMIDSTERYIAYNPLKWSVMYGSNGGLRVVEPLVSPRFAIGDYWKGVGNVALLSPNEKIVSLRVSREVAIPKEISAVVRRMESAVDKGYVIISGFISKGERAVRDMLCQRKDARFIRVLPSCLPNKRFKPESVYVAPFAQNRYLEIARGNDESEFGRRACLDLNEEIIEIAIAGEGLALYWTHDGLKVLARTEEN